MGQSHIEASVKVDTIEQRIPGCLIPLVRQIIRTYEVEEVYLGSHTMVRSPIPAQVNLVGDPLWIYSGGSSHSLFFQDGVLSIASIADGWQDTDPQTCWTLECGWNDEEGKSDVVKRYLEVREYRLLEQEKEEDEMDLEGGREIRRVHHSPEPSFVYHRRGIILKMKEQEMIDSKKWFAHVEMIGGRARSHSPTYHQC